MMVFFNLMKAEWMKVLLYPVLVGSNVALFFCVHVCVCVHVNLLTPSCGYMFF